MIFTTHLLVARVCNVVKQGHVLVAARLGVGDAGQAGELEAHGVAALATEKRRIMKLMPDYEVS